MHSQNNWCQIRWCPEHQTNHYISATCTAITLEIGICNVPPTNNYKIRELLHAQSEKHDFRTCNVPPNKKHKLRERLHAQSEHMMMYEHIMPHQPPPTNTHKIKELLHVQSEHITSEPVMSHKEQTHTKKAATCTVRTHVGTHNVQPNNKPKISELPIKHYN